MILPDTVGKTLDCGVLKSSKITEKIATSKHCSSLKNYAKITVEYGRLFFFAIADLKNFIRCNVI